MTRSQKPGSNAASARDRVPAGFFHATRFEAAARRDAMCRENARSSMEKSTRGRHGLPRRSRQRGVRMQAQARGRPQPGTALSTSAQERQGRSRSRQAEEQILCASAVLQRTRRTAAWQARNRAQRALPGTEGRNGKAGGSRVRAAEYPSSGEAETPPDDAGNNRRHKTDAGVETTVASRAGAGMSTTVAAGNGKVTGHKRRQERNNRRRNGQHSRDRTPAPGRASGHAPQEAARAFAQTNTTRPALPPPETGHAPCPAHKKRRSAKPKFCRTPDRHGSGLARSLNRTFSYRMKLVRMTGSFSGSGTPAALPASKQRSIHAMFLAS